MLTKEQIAHGERIAARKAINGQPNGYRPISEEGLQAEKAAEFLRRARAA